MSRKRYKRAKVLAYPADWFWCLAIGFMLGGITVWLLLT